MVCLDNTSIIHSEGDGTFTLNPQRLLVKNKNDLKVLRIKEGLSDELKKELTLFLRIQVGSLYSVKDALLTLTYSQTEKESSSQYQFCSRLVAQAYDSINYQLVKNKDFCSPEDINRSEILVEVEDMIRKTNSTDTKFALKRNFVLENQKSTYDWLNKTRTYAYDTYKFEINTQNDVDKFLWKYKEADKMVCEYIEASGYLENYKISMKNNPHMYDKDIFINKFKKLEENEKYIIDMIIGEFRKEPSLIERFFKDYTNSINNFNNTKLQYYQLQINLYKNLLSDIMSRLITLHEVYMDYFQKGLIDNHAIILDLTSCLQVLKDNGIEKYKF
jgi:hypothetical protein